MTSKPKFTFLLNIDKPTAYRIKNSHSYQVHNSKISLSRRVALSQASFLVDRRIIPEIRSHLTPEQKKYAQALWMWVGQVKQEQQVKFPDLSPLALLRKKVAPQLTYKNFIKVGIPFLDSRIEKINLTNKEASTRTRLEAKADKLSTPNSSGEYAILKKLGLSEVEALALAKTLAHLSKKY